MPKSDLGKVRLRVFSPSAHDTGEWSVAQLEGEAGFGGFARECEIFSVMREDAGD
jgi:hypothetical protein